MVGAPDLLAVLKSMITGASLAGEHQVDDSQQLDAQVFASFRIDQRRLETGFHGQWSTAHSRQGPQGTQLRDPTLVAGGTVLQEYSRIRYVFFGDRLVPLGQHLL